MRTLALLLALSGCNQAFSIEKTQLVDAAPVFFDAPPEPPPGCPAIGTPLVFAPGLTQAVAQNCQRYLPSFAPQSAVAFCSANGDRESLYEGRLDGAMFPAKLDVPCAPPNRCFEIRTTPEGSDAFFVWFEDATVSYHYDRLQRGADRTFRRVGPFTSPGQDSMNDDNWSQPTRGPERHMIVIGVIFPPIREIVATEPYDTWTEVAQYKFSDFNLLGLHAPRLSPDGLRLIVSGFPMNGTHDQTMIAERATITDRFGPAVPVAGVPPAEDAVLSDDCDRMYFFGLDSVFYQKRVR